MEDCGKAVRIVLVRPRNPLNIAAAARAARNFGFEDLAVVAPYGPVWEEARAAAGAKRWLSQARVFPRLPEAIEDRNWVIGASCLARRQPADPLRILSLDGLSAYWKKQTRRERVALLFGSEKRGLSNEDLSYCHHIVRIPTTTQSPSMNLGQAVAVCCYEMRRCLVPRRAPGKVVTSCATVGEIARLVEELDQLLRGTTARAHNQSRDREGAGLARGREKSRQARLQQMLLRWPVSSRDVTLVLGVLRDLTWQLQQKSSSVPAPPAS